MLLGVVVGDMSVPITQERQSLLTHHLEHHISNPMEGSEFIVFTDASVSGDLSKIGLGWLIIRPNGDIVCKGSKGFEKENTTVQHAELLAVKYAIDQLNSMDWLDKGVTVYLDNESVVESFHMETAVTEYDAFDSVSNVLSQDNVYWVKRDFNEIADELSVEAREEIDR